VLSNLFARALQLAMTQPIRIDDALLVGDEWAWSRRSPPPTWWCGVGPAGMIVPLTYFHREPFQNWTRETSTLIGNVLFYLDTARRSGHA